MSADCIFCKIVAGEIPGDIVFRNAYVTAFRDINPLRPVHILVVPNEHLASTEELSEAHVTLAGHFLLAAKQIAAQEGISESGYRLIINTGKAGHQEVFHLHMHILGGKPMRQGMG